MSAKKARFQIAECSQLYQKKKDGLILKTLKAKEGQPGFRKEPFFNETKENLKFSKYYFKICQ